MGKRKVGSDRRGARNRRGIELQRQRHEERAFKARVRDAEERACLPDREPLGGTGPVRRYSWPRPPKFWTLPPSPGQAARATAKRAIPSDGRAGTMTFKCYLCKTPFAGPYHAGLAAHRRVCASVQIDRYCGICKGLLSRDEPLSRKYHRGVCAEKANVDMWRRCRTSIVWDVAEIKQVLQAVARETPVAEIAQAHDVTVSTLRSYAKRWRAYHSIYVPTLKTSWPVSNSVYPYIKGPLREEHSLLVAVDAVVPKSLPYEVRGDVCQELILAVLAGDVNLEQLPEAVPLYIKQHYRSYGGGMLSLEAPRYGRDGEPLAPLVDVLVAHDGYSSLGWAALRVGITTSRVRGKSVILPKPEERRNEVWAPMLRRFVSVPDDEPVFAEAVS